MGLNGDIGALFQACPEPLAKWDLVRRKDAPGSSQSKYQIIAIAHDGKSVTLCLMHGGQQTNFELRNVPIDTLIWLD